MHNISLNICTNDIMTQTWKHFTCWVSFIRQLIVSPIQSKDCRHSDVWQSFFLWQVELRHSWVNTTAAYWQLLFQNTNHVCGPHHKYVPTIQHPYNSVLTEIWSCWAVICKLTVSNVLHLLLPLPRQRPLWSDLCPKKKASHFTDSQVFLLELGHPGFDLNSCR